MGSGDGMKELIEKLAAKIDDLKTSLDKLAPLARVAEQLATLPSKVVALQSSAFENQEQVRPLNLAIPRAENAQREGRVHAKENGDTTGEGSINRARQGLVPALENDRQPPKDRFHQLPPEQLTKLSPRPLHDICGGGRSHMGQALHGAAGRVRAPPSPAPVPLPRPPPPLRASPAATSGGTRQDRINVSQDDVTPPPKDALGVLKECDPSYDEMLKHMVGRITTKPGGKPKRGEAFVEDRYNRPLPKVRTSKPEPREGNHRQLPPGTINVTQRGRGSQDCIFPQPSPALLVRRRSHSDSGAPAGSRATAGRLLIADTNNSTIRYIVLNGKDADVHTLDLIGVQPPTSKPKTMRRLRRRLSADTDVINVDGGSSMEGFLSLAISVSAGYHFSKEAHSKFDVDIEPADAIEIEPVNGFLNSEGQASLNFKRMSPSSSTGRITCKVYYCKEDEVCLYQSVAFDVKFREEAVSSPAQITLSYSVVPRDASSNAQLITTRKNGKL
ncbi:hypothetical protein GUJ93_ZPchr0013g37250 [Zizania palustris]|uniref:Uncharacterized protein n=1 Tax=Zizania palustris TaxID=103762 RepID=A0A8J6BTY2_ZIZPA|nr:hypothetical protein GUJ93_ZPchr0013g37250 [Zizania palustris]